MATATSRSPDHRLASQSETCLPSRCTVLPELEKIWSGFAGAVG